MQKQLFMSSLVITALLFTSRIACAQQGKPLTTGSITYSDPRLETLLPKGAVIEILASGLQNAEGPVWIGDSSFLLFSDTKAQIIYRQPVTGERTKFLEHSGFTGRLPYGEEPGSNGMVLNKKAELLMCEHGDRRIAAYAMNGSYGKRTITDNYQGKRLNSPNDIIIKSDGSFYFTDPPYGLPQKDVDSHKETTANGVYRIDGDGKITLLISDLGYPNGLAFSPDEKLLYVSVSDMQQPHIMVYSVKPDGTVGAGKMFFDASALPRESIKEVTDGFKIDQQGNLWASGPGGLLIIDHTGKLLGVIRTGEVVTNCAWSDDGSMYITAGAFLYRVKTSTKGTPAGK